MLAETGHPEFRLVPEPVKPKRSREGSCDVARAHDCPLLSVGDDFSLTDIPSALDAAPR